MLHPNIIIQHLKKYYLTLSLLISHQRQHHTWLLANPTESNDEIYIGGNVYTDMHHRFVCSIFDQLSFAYIPIKIFGPIPVNGGIW